MVDLSKPKLILGLVPVWNRLTPIASEIFIATVGQSSTHFLQTCIPTVMEGGVIRYYQNQPYVISMTNNVRDASRYMDYSVHEQLLRELLEKEQKHIWLGTGRPDQFEIMKNIFKEDVVTLSMNYDDSLVRNIAIDFLAIAKFYNVSIFSEETLESLMEKIPNQFHYPADIEINLSDIYDYDKLKKLLYDTFNESFNEDKLSIWSAWMKEQELLRGKYESI